MNLSPTPDPSHHSLSFRCGFNSRGNRFLHSHVFSGQEGDGKYLGQGYNEDRTAHNMNGLLQIDNVIRSLEIAGHIPFASDASSNVETLAGILLPI